MKAYKCPSCGALDTIQFLNQDFFCIEDNCNWAFTFNNKYVPVEVVEIIDWEHELKQTNNEQNN